MISGMNKPITLSAHAQALAEKRARDDGFDSVEAYLNALIEEDSADLPDWMRKLVDEGLKSGSAGEMTEARLDQLVEDGIARASRKA
jgi:hypothetical protein